MPRACLVPLLACSWDTLNSSDGTNLFAWYIHAVALHQQGLGDVAAQTLSTVADTVAPRAVQALVHHTAATWLASMDDTYTALLHFEAALTALAAGRPDPWAVEPTHGCARDQLCRQ